MGAPERRPLRSSKHQIDGVLSRYLFTHIVKYRVIILRKVAHVARKKESLISIAHIVQGLNLFTSQNSITENGNSL